MNFQAKWLASLTRKTVSLKHDTWSVNHVIWKRYLPAFQAHCVIKKKNKSITFQLQRCI